MRPAHRLVLFVVGAAGVAVLFGLALARLPAPAAIRSPLGEAINKRVVAERHVTDAVTAVNFDYRGFDTLGEEFILFASVVGALVLLREVEAKRERPLPDAITSVRVVPPSDAVRVWTLSMIGPKVVLGLYIVLHGQLTPGGGFQGGVVLATAALLIYLNESFEVFKRVTSFRLIEIAEATGAAGYALIGLLGILYSGHFLANVLPLGDTGSLLSGGTIPLINISTGLEVAAGFTLLLYAFLQATLERGEAHP